jgi:DNA-binding CsgD family transcriptional regulator
MLLCDSQPPSSLEAKPRHAPTVDTVETIVLELTLRGYSLKQVAMELGVSNGLACRIRQRALGKLNLGNVCEFVVACAAGNLPEFGTPVSHAQTRAVATMTPAERDVADRVLLGHSNADIARQRGTTERTVANQLTTLFRKLSINSRIELVLLLVSRHAN